MPEVSRRLSVELGDRSYPILIGAGVLGQEDLTPYVAGDRVLIVTNDAVGPLYLDKAAKCFPGKAVDSVVLPDGERHKNWQTLNLIFDALLEGRHTRSTTLVALGGGVVGDMTGFAAASYQRGVAFIQIPTTLLSQVDSSVGGKTGINHPLGKNMIGAFHQPEVVLIDTDTLKTLPSEEVSAGLAEVIKYGLIRDSGFLEWIEDNLAGLMALDAELLAEAIYRSCLCKAEVVAVDEREGGLRAILNLGHTFGHAIETYTGYGSWLHGQAVGTGMLMAADLSQRAGMIADSDVVRIRSVIEKAALPLSPPKGMAAEDFLRLMAVDKKNLDGSLHLVLLEAVGTAIVSNTFRQADLQQTLDHFCC